MIFYFTGTGNSEQLAKQIAAKTGDKVVNITDAVRNKEYTYTVSEGENLGFSIPVYFSGVPHIVKEFREFLRLCSQVSLKSLYLQTDHGQYTF